MRRALLATVVSLLSLAPAAASAAGPVLQGGVIRTSLADQGDLRFDGLAGGGYKVGFEVGSHRWRSEWSFNQAILSGSSQGYDNRLTLSGFAFQETFMFWKKGLTPYIGLGAEGGMASLKATSFDYTYTDIAEGVYLRPYAIVGARLQFGFGLGLRAELSGSFYGEFFAMSTNLGLSYTW